MLRLDAELVQDLGVAALVGVFLVAFLRCCLMPVLHAKMFLTLCQTIS